MTDKNPNLDLAYINVYIKFGEIPSIWSQDIKWIKFWYQWRAITLLQSREKWRPRLCSNQSIYNFWSNCVHLFSRGRLDLAVLFTPSTPNRQNRNQVHWNICAGVRRSTPSSEVVQTEQSRDLFQKRWRIIACMRGHILYRLIYSGVLQSAQFYLFMWLFWRTPSTLKIAKSSPPQIISGNGILT